MPRKFFPFFFPTCRSRCIVQARVTAARRFPLPTCGERLAFLFVPLTLSHRISFSHPPYSTQFTREAYTLHAIVHDDSVRIHVYACTRKAAPFVGDSESKRRRFYCCVLTCYIILCIIPFILQPALITGLLISLYYYSMHL